MSSKVIKWFKRQASIRRFTDKSEEKGSASKSGQGEKKKSSFPRISLKRKKKKSDLEENSLAVVGISKKYSHSVPNQMESGNLACSTTVVSNSVSSDNTVHSPSKYDSPSKSSISEYSYHSSYDNEAHSSEFSREFSPTDDIDLEKTPFDSDTSRITDTFHTGLASPDKSFPSDMSEEASSQPLFNKFSTQERLSMTKNKHPPGKSTVNVIPTIVIDQPSSLSSSKPPLAAVESYSSDELSCLSDLDEMEVKSSVSGSMDNFTEIDKLIEKTEADLKLVENKSDSNLLSKDATNNKVLLCDQSKNYNYVQLDTKINELCDNNEHVERDIAQDDLNSQYLSSKKNDIVVCKMLENTELVIYECGDERPGSSSASSIMTNCNDIDFNHSIIEISVDNPPVDIVQEELPRTKDDNVGHMDSNDIDSSDSVSLCISSSTDSVREVLNDGSSFESADSDDDKVTVVNQPIVHQEDDLSSLKYSDSRDYKDEIIDKNNAASKSEEKCLNTPVNVEKLEENLEPSLNEEDNCENNLNSDVSLEINSHNEAENNLHPKLTNFHEQIDYPDELNPFESDEETKIEDSVTIVYDKKETEPKENETKENGKNPFGSDTEIEEEYNAFVRNSPRNTSQECSPNFCRVSSENLNGQLLERRGSETYLKSIPKINLETATEMKSHFSVGDLHSRLDQPPNLPPKSERRKISSGSMVPIPRPRKTKLHGSTTSLQNISSFPVPAPRSITPCGSTRTLNESSTNPFADDMDDEDDTSSVAFERRTHIRSTLQDCTYSSLGRDFGRTEMARGSLPPSSRVRRKKRPAPLPPSGASNKPQNSELVARKRSFTTSPSENSDRKTSLQKLSGPFRAAPPRPPPPRI